MGLVHYCVTDVTRKRRRRLQAVTRDDLVQEGAIGLARAVDRWNPAVGGKFSTYAVYWIRAAVLRCIAERDDLVRVPEHVTATLAKVTRAAAGLNVELNSGAWREAAHAKALAERAGISDRQLAEAMKVRERRNVGVLSFESWMQQGHDYETDLVSSPTEELSKANGAVDVEQMKQTLSRFLRPREMEALSLRYGLDEQSSTYYYYEYESKPHGSCSSRLRGASRGGALWRCHRETCSFFKARRQEGRGHELCRSRSAHEGVGGIRAKTLPRGARQAAAGRGGRRTGTGVPVLIVTKET